MLLSITQTRVFLRATALPFNLFFWVGKITVSTTWTSVPLKDVPTHTCSVICVYHLNEEGNQMWSFLSTGNLYYLYLGFVSHRYTNHFIFKIFSSCFNFCIQAKFTNAMLSFQMLTYTCVFIVTFPIYGWSEAIRKPDSRCVVCNAYVSIKSKLFSYKIWK